MPQFDYLSFTVQVIYLTISFVAFYLLVEFYFLVKVSQAIKARKKAISLSAKLMAAKNKSNENALNNFIFKSVLKIHN